MAGAPLSSTSAFQEHFQLVPRGAQEPGLLPKDVHFRGLLRQGVLELIQLFPTAFAQQKPFFVEEGLKSIVVNLGKRGDVFIAR